MTPNQSRFVEAHCVAVRDAIRRDPRGWRHVDGDVDGRAARTSATVAGFILAGATDMLDITQPWYHAACRALRIPCTREAIDNFLKG